MKEVRAQTSRHRKSQLLHGFRNDTKTLNSIYLFPCFFLSFFSFCTFFVYFLKRNTSQKRSFEQISRDFESASDSLHFHSTFSFKFLLLQLFFSFQFLLFQLSFGVTYKKILNFFFNFVCTFLYFNLFFFHIFSI